MFCSNCGKEISETDKFCGNCGKFNDHFHADAEDDLGVTKEAEKEATTETSEPSAQAETVYTEDSIYETPNPQAGEASDASHTPENQVPQTEKSNENPVFGILALVFSIFAFFNLGSTWIPGFVFSVIGLSKYKDKTSSNRKRAKAGLILSIVLAALVVFLLLAVVMLWFVLLFSATDMEYVTVFSDPELFFDLLF